MLNRIRWQIYVYSMICSINMPLCARIEPVLDRNWQYRQGAGHVRPGSGPVLKAIGIFLLGVHLKCKMTVGNVIFKYCNISQIPHV